MQAGPAIAVMAKAPRPGLAKTRLIPALGAEGAAALARAFLEDSAALAADVAAQAGGAALVFATPDDACDEIAAITGLETLGQGAGDLGARMVAAFETLFARGHRAAILIGTDSPALPASHLATALTLLAAQPGRAVFGPAGDGGYWMVGLTAPAPALFQGIGWGGSEVMAATGQAAARANIALALAPTWDDTDEPADLPRLAAQLAADPACAPVTRAALGKLWRC